MQAEFSIGHARKLRWGFLYQALVYALGMAFGVGLIPDWGRWYSMSHHHRAQVDAFLRGSLQLTHEPSGLTHDLAWSEQGVHQVWGLGVPLWQAPFEFVARCFGEEAFPGMLALTLAMGLAAWGVLLVLFAGKCALLSARPSARMVATIHAVNSSLAHWTWLTGAAGLLLLFPPFVNLLHSRFDIYEEVVAYEYLLGLGLIAGIIQLAQRPSPRSYWLLCALAGGGGVFRPTLVFHGAAAVLAAAVALRWGYGMRPIYIHSDALLPMETTGAPHTRSLCPADGEWISAGQSVGVLPNSGETEPPRLMAWNRWAGTTAVGLGLFFVGGGILFVTNLIRFGNGFEFGHRLNVQNLYGSLYATRFDHPYATEPLSSAARELFGLLFLTEDYSHGFDFYRESFFPGQSLTLRWREVYLTAYDLSYLAWLVAGVAAGIVAWRKLWRRRTEKSEWLSNEQAWLVAVVALAVYGTVASALFLAFYLRCEVISSRYLLDLMPSFGALMLAGWLAWGLFWMRRREGRWVMPLSLVLLAGWLCWEIHHSDSTYGPPRVLTWEEVKAQKSHAGGWTNPPPTGVYDSSAAPAATGIPYNGQGWKRPSGMVMPCVILFVSDPALLELQVATNTTAAFTPQPEQFRAKVGLEFLKREFIQQIESGWLIRFHGPEKRRYQTGLQPVFLATVPNTHLADDSTPWRLLKIRWKDPDPTVQSPRSNVQSRDSTNQPAEPSARGER